MKTSCWALSLLTALLAAPGAVASSAHSFEGVGEARVVGGNVVSARRQALFRARRAALAAAIASVADPVSLAEPIRAALLAQSALIRTYRVLEEVREGGAFRLRVAVQVDMVALRRQLLRRGVKPRAPAAPAARTVALWAPPKLRAPLERGLRGRGYQVLALRGSVAQARAQLRSKAALVVLVRLRQRPAAGVRGLGLEGAQIELSAEVRSSPSWSALGTLGTITSYGAGRNAAAAQQEAMAQGVPRLLRDLVALLAKNVTGPALAPGDALVGVIGLGGLAEMGAICRLLRSKAVQACKLRRMEAGRVWLHLSGTSGIAGIARLLSAHDFSGFVLALERTRGQRIWLRARRGPPPPAITAP